jgi:hypothetical protein
MKNSKKKAKPLRGKTGAFLALLVGGVFQFGGCAAQVAANQALNAFNQAFGQIGSSFPFPPGF